MDDYSLMVDICEDPEDSYNGLMAKNFGIKKIIAEDKKNGRQ